MTDLNGKRPQRSTSGALAVAAVVILALVGGCGELPTGPASTEDMALRGVTLADWTATGYATSSSLAAVDRIYANGANLLTILVTAYQTGASASEVRIDNQLTPTDAAVTAVITKTQTFSDPPLDVAIKLHVDLDDGEWRGTISPADPAGWFESYRAFVVFWASFAELFGASQFVVGTELAGTLDHEAHWRALIADVRDVFSGELIYAASWDEAPLVPFWDAVDLVGVNFYAPVATRRETNRFDMLRGWQPWLDRIRLLHKKAGRDVLFSEIGYRSVDGAGMHPYDFSPGAAEDAGEQADLYWAALQALGDKPWVRGIYWWNWLANGTPEGERLDYTPNGKPAEEELSDAWGR